jgi:hypothetical protein
MGGRVSGANDQMISTCRHKRFQGSFFEMHHFHNFFKLEPPKVHPAGCNGRPCPLMGLVVIVAAI